jgi:hypothetical protein
LDGSQWSTMGGYGVELFRSSFYSVVRVSFFLTLLEIYSLQLHHLTLHAFTLVVIFTHFCEMFVGVRLSVRLF